MSHSGLTRLPALLLALAASLPAAAGGPVEPLAEPAVAAPAPDWQGPYIGLLFGMPTGDNTFGRADFDVYSTPSDWGGSVATLRAGHDWQRGAFVFGVALEASSGDIANEPIPGPQVICFDRCEIGVSGLRALTGRVGYAFGRTLVYATAGVADGTARMTAIAGVVTIGEDKLTGWTAGLGVERGIGPQLTLLAEYRHTDLGNLGLSCFDTCHSAIAFGLAQLGLAYRW